MADMYTPEEIQAIFDAVAEANAKQIPLSKELAVAYEDAKKGVKNYTRELDASLKKLGSSAISLAKSIKDNKQGADVFSDSISSGADAVSKFASRFGILGQVFGGIAKAGAAYIGAVNKQSDALYKSYQEMSRFGGVGAGGMTEVFANLKRFGYGVEELGNMTALIAESSKELAVFNGSVFGGARELANLSADITSSGLQQQFMNMGMSVDEINRGNRAYYLQMNRLNRQQQLTTQGAAAYHTEMEALSRLTGQTRKEMEDQRLQALQMDEVFAAINKSADPNKIYAVFDTISNPKLRKAIGQSLNGIVGQSEEQMQYIQATNGRIVDLSMQLQQGAISVDDFNRELALSLKSNMGVREDISIIAGAGKFMGDSLFEDAMYIKKYGAANSTTLEGMKKEVERAGSGFDKATDAASALRISQMKSRDAMENFLNAGVKPVTQAMEILAKAVEYLTLLIPFGGRAKAQYEKEKADAAKKQADLENKAVPSKTPIKIEGEGLAGIREMIAAKESGGDYNVMVGGQKMDLTNMSIADVMNMQSNRKAAGMNTAAGKYQIINSTLQGLVAEGGIDTNAKFDQQMQDRLADMLIQKRGYGDYKSGKITKEDFATNLSKEWAALPSGPANQSYYAGVGNNKAHYSWDQVMGMQFANGGIASGPTSGYQAMLHGTEAVVPLEDGRSIPVTNTGSPEQMGIMSSQLDKLDELISVMKNQLSVSNRILQMQT
jgi:muramidase (phage lysozyme)